MIRTVDYEKRPYPGDGCIDAGVLPIVGLIRDLGFDTFYACSGLRADHPIEGTPATFPGLPWQERVNGTGNGRVVMGGAVQWFVPDHATFGRTVVLAEMLSLRTEAMIGFGGMPYGLGGARGCVAELRVQEVADTYDALNDALVATWAAVRDVLDGGRFENGTIYRAETTWFVGRE